MKLFIDKRLSVNEPEHLAFIKGTLASMKIDNPPAYEDLSQFYGVDMDVKVVKEPKVGEEAPKKRGRKPKVETVA